MPARIAQFYGIIFLWHGIRHFNSYPLLGSQSFFKNPFPEWLVLGLLQVLAGGILLLKPKPWCLVLAAGVLILWGMAYPVVLHVGDSAFILLLLGLATVQFGGAAWIPVATLPCVVGIGLAGLWKLRSGAFSVCNLTNIILVRYPWMDGMHLMLNQHQTLAAFLSNMTIGIELTAPCIWLLLFLPRLWRWRSLLALLPISLLFGIGITGNLDEFPWVMLTAWLLMLGPRQPESNASNRLMVYALAFVLCAASFIYTEVNLRKMYSGGTDPFFDLSAGLLPDNRVKKMAAFIVAPKWSMYSEPAAHEQMFGGDAARTSKLEARITSAQGCGLALNRWERIYWERIRAALMNPQEHEEAVVLMSNYKTLAGRPCAIAIFPPSS